MPGLSFVGASGGSSNSAVTTLATTARALTAGNHHYVYVGWYNRDTTPTLSDTAGNTYTPMSRVVLTDEYGMWFYKHGCAGNASNVVTATFPLSVSFTNIRAIELSGDTPAVSQASITGSAVTYLELGEPGLAFGDGSAVLVGVSGYSSTTTYTFGQVDNQVAPAWTEVVSHYNYGGAAYALYPSGRAGVAPTLTMSASNTRAILVALQLSLGVAPASDTVVNTAQLTAEVLRTNLGVDAQLAQLSVEVVRAGLGAQAQLAQISMEVLRPNAAAVSSVRPVLIRFGF